MESNNTNVGFEKHIWDARVFYGGIFLLLNIEK